MKTLFKNGTILDGSGEAPVKGDVLIEDDRILAVGGTIDEGADKVVDITGMEICPGLIDAHSHNDFFYDRADAEKFYKPFIEQGITTQITGNCSFSRPIATRSAAASLTRRRRAALRNSKSAQRAISSSISCR